MILNLCPNPSIDSYAWLNNFESGGVNRISKMIEYPGGKGVHVALALAELGEDARLMGLWAGNTGDWIKKACLGKKVRSIGVELPGNNRKCYTFLSEDPTFDNSELLEPGPSMTSESWEEFKIDFRKQLSNIRLACMSGSWPQNAPHNAYSELIEVAAENGVRTILDCSGIQLEEAIKTGFFGLHLNQEEAAKLCGSSRMPDLLNKLNNKVELIALTRGKEGLEIYYKGKIISANVEIDKVISTVGSGDCLTAGIAFAVEKDLPLEDIAAYGVACGAANCLTEDLGMLKKEDVERLLPLVKVKEYTDGQ